MEYVSLEILSVLYFRNLQGPQNHELMLGMCPLAAHHHLPGWGGGVRCGWAARPRWTELGGPGLLWTLEMLGTMLRGGRGQPL